MTEEFVSPPGTNYGIKILDAGEGTAYHSGFAIPAPQAKPGQFRSALDIQREKLALQSAQSAATRLSRLHGISPPLTAEELLRAGFTNGLMARRAEIELVERVLQSRAVAPSRHRGIFLTSAPPPSAVPVITESVEFPWSVKEVCRQLGISKSTLKRWHAEGLVPDPPVRVTGHRGGRKANRYGPEWMTETRANLGYPE